MDDDDFDEILAGIDIPPPEKVAAVAGHSGSNSTAAIPGPTKKTTKTNCILVNPKQRGNPILKSITNIPYEWEDIVPDYIVGATTCILYLSLKYHNLNPDYITQRLKTLGRMFELRILLVQVDVKDPYNALKTLTRISLLTNLTMMLAWSIEEAGKIVETYKMYENKPPDLIMERAEEDPHSRLVNALTNIKAVNKTDAMNLLQNFGTLEKLAGASEDKLATCTGLGPRKRTNLVKTFNENFLK